MDAVDRELSELFTGAFDLVLKMEQNAFRGTRFSDLSVAEIHTIDAVGKEERSMGEIASRLGITLATLNAAIGRLCAKGYAERRRTEQDRRLVLVRLTRQGQIVFRLHERFHEKLIARAVDGLSEQERDLLSGALAKIRIMMEDLGRRELEVEAL